ncbi:uncharacterized protein LOC143035191 [Oratosquilla oratoria]|uniref:uncharacterized protein LOC143035191 n=1 Tax=Oratosquilla oratoria TaxID=337810 RepID=UPI003F769A08
MAPIENSTEMDNDSAKNICYTGADEGFESPSVQGPTARKEESEKVLEICDSSRNSRDTNNLSDTSRSNDGQSLQTSLESSSVQRPTARGKESEKTLEAVNSNRSSKDNDNQSDSSQSDDGCSVSTSHTDLKSKPKVNSEKTESKSTPVSTVDCKSPSVRNFDPVNKKAETVAEFVVLTLVGRKDGRSNDKVEQTMLRCVQRMMQKHEILLRGMMRRLQITRETGYMTFVSVANEIFEGQKAVVNWGRVIALYAFGGQLALYCKDKSMEDYVQQIVTFTGRYAAEVVTPFVVKAGGWNKLCEEFPQEDDLENKAWKFLTWTAVGLGLAATASFLTSH